MFFRKKNSLFGSIRELSGLLFTMLILLSSVLWADQMPELKTAENPLQINKSITLQLKKISDIASDEFNPAEVESACEDADGNIYILDQNNFKIRKFSPEGKLLLSFGNKGRKSGDFSNPNHITITASNTIAVCEDFIYVSFFDFSGKFLKRTRISKGMKMKYINDNLFFGWEWTKSSIKQVLLNANGKVLKSFSEISKDASSVLSPDENGRMIAVEYGTPEYTPVLLSDTYRGNAVLGVGDRYEILILDQEGRVVKILKRDIPAPAISPKEVEYFSKEIDKNSNLSEDAKNKFKEKIPQTKNFFNDIMLSGKYVFVFTIKPDVTDTNSGIPMDIFSMEGDYIGTATVKDHPLLVTEKYIYFVEPSGDKFSIIKYEYSLEGRG